MTDRTREESAGGEATRLLQRVAAGEVAASEELLPLVYDEMRRMAGGFMRGQSPAHTLQPTAVVHEVWIKLCGGAGADWRSRAHFLAVASKAMRQVLIDHARGRRADKRGGGLRNLTLDEALCPTPQAGALTDLLALDDALTQLRALNGRHADIVEMRFFGGLDVRGVAEVLGVSVSTVEKDWAMARAWLFRALSAA